MLEARAEILQKIWFVFWEIWQHRNVLLRLTDLYLLKRNSKNLQSTVHSVLRKVCLGTEPYSFVYICQSVHFATLFFLPGVLSLTSVHIHNGPKLFSNFFHLFQDKRNIAFHSTSLQKVSFGNYFIKECEQKKIYINMIISSLNNSLKMTLQFNKYYTWQ